jgi:hypothetical protein
LSIVDLEQPPVDSKNRTVGDRHDDGPDSGGGTPTGTWQRSPESAAADTTSQPFGGASATSLAELAPISRRIDEIALVPPLVQTPVQLVAVGTIEEPAVEPLSDFGETEPLQVAHQGRTFFARGYEEGESRTRPWMWVGLFAATGILAVVSTVWWFTLRDSGTALATSVVERSEPAAAATPVPVADRGPAAAPAAPPGLEIEVRRTAWIRTIVDGKEDSRVYQAGETRQISGAKTVSIRAGDGGAVFVSVDGRPAEPLGSGGVAVTRQYSLAGDTAAPVPAVATASPVPAIEPLAATPAVSNAVPTPRPENQSLPLPGARPAEVARAAAAAAAPPSNAPATIAPATPVPGASPAPSTADTSAAPSGGGRADLIAAGQQRLDAYQRRDREGMSSSGTENMGISDERSITERFPAWQAGVRRDLDQVELELSGDTALLTARMTERSGDTSASGQQHVSRVSQIWVRRAGRWRLADVRIIGEARLNQIVR